MKANDVRVYAKCTRCDWVLNPYPLDPVIEKLGPDFSLFDRRPKCREPRLAGAPKCGGEILFLYRAPGDHGTPFRPCTTKV